MNRTMQLAEKIKKIEANHSEEIKALNRRGVKGGTNALYIDGWIHSPSGTITRAAHIAKLPTMPYWSGSAPTPSTAIPRCVYADVCAAYAEIFTLKGGTAQ